MKVTNSTITMAAKRTYLEQYDRQEELKFWIGKNRPNFAKEEEGKEKPTTNQSVRDYILNLNLNQTDTPEQKHLRDKMNKEIQIASSQAACELSEEAWNSEKEKLTTILVEKMIELLTGKKVKIDIPEVPGNASTASCPEDPIPQDSETAPPPKQGWGLEYDYEESYYEQESVAFSANGIIQTADGQKIDFSATVNMSREFMQKQEIHIRAGDAVKIDPLVINFGGSTAQLGNTSFNFDLDCDGQVDQLSSLLPSSGFLALDKNKDGTINDGSELFGPQSGDGFAELGGYDEDGNNWIDENDSIYEKLRIWYRDPQGNDTLFALGEKGIGAIYLGNLSTLFSLKNTANETAAEIKKTGLYVKEDGKVGTIQHVDFAV